MSTAPIKSDYFDLAQQQRLDADDTEAFTSVSAILLFIVTGGLLLGAVSVLAIMATS
jgi:hypothetical protein